MKIEIVQLKYKPNRHQLHEGGREGGREGGSFTSKNTLTLDLNVGLEL